MVEVLEGRTMADEVCEIARIEEIDGKIVELICSGKNQAETARDLGVKPSEVASRVRKVTRLARLPKNPATWIAVKNMVNNNYQTLVQMSQKMVQVVVASEGEMHHFDF
jgi:DNA-binding ferritin-like protein